jgi:hypothetical protein
MPLQIKIKIMPLQIKILIAILVCFLITRVVNYTYNSSVDLYNKSKQYALSYEKVKQEQISNYDGYYNTFIDKQDNANINKETFLYVTNIIMSNRKDGEQLSWKWVTENQQIPYNEFSDFYIDLSNFIRERYADNMQIERNKQALVNSHNLLISTYPNNIINKWLNIQPLTYEFGFISKETKQKFK